LAGATHLFACLSGSAKVSQIFSHGYKSVKIIGVDERGDSATSAGEVHRRVGSAGFVHDIG
jgi:hypothetical protein